MNSETDAINLQNVGIIFLLCLALAVVLVGILLWKTRLWDRDKKGKYSPSRRIGGLMILIGAIFAFILLLFLIEGIVRLGNV